MVSSKGFHFQLYKRIVSGDVELPCLPDVSLKIRRTISSSHFHLNDVVTLLQGDPGVASHLLKMADSPLYHRPTPALDLKTAIHRLGASAACNIVTTYSIKNLFFSRSPLLMQYVREAWHRSLKSAAICSVLAKTSGVIEPDQAMLGGLLQEVGSLLLLLQLEDQQELLQEPKQVYQMCNEVGADIGVVLLKHWGLDEQFVEVVRQRDNWSRDTRRPYDLVDLGILARHLSLGHSPQLYQLPTLEEMPIYQKALFHTTALPRRLGLFDHLRPEIETVLNLLGGSLTPPPAPRPPKHYPSRLKSHSG